jgi:hypothetical protein
MLPVLTQRSPALSTTRTNRELHLERFVAVIVGLKNDAGVTAATWLIERDQVWPLQLGSVTLSSSD